MSIPALSTVLVADCSQPTFCSVSLSAARTHDTHPATCLLPSSSQSRDDDRATPHSGNNHRWTTSYFLAIYIQEGGKSALRGVEEEDEQREKTVSCQLMSHQLCQIKH